MGLSLVEGRRFHAFTDATFCSGTITAGASLAAFTPSLRAEERAPPCHRRSPT